MLVFFYVSRWPHTQKCTIFRIMQRTSVAASSATTTPTYLAVFVQSSGSTIFLNDLYFKFYNHAPRYSLFALFHSCIVRLIFLIFVISHPRMSTAQQYEQLLNEVQLLKKTLTGEKIAHQSTISQLEQSYNLNLELQQVIKSQTATITSLNRQLSDKSNKLAEMSQNYQIQLVELKEFVHAKERELQGIRGTLVVTDYDMIRMRVISELELVHRQQIQEIQKQRDRLHKLWNDQKQEKLLTGEKYGHIKKEMERQAQKFQQERQENERKHMREINKVHEKLELALKQFKQVEKALEQSQKRHQSLQEKYESQINKAYQQLKPSSMPVYRSESSEEDRRRVGKLEANLQQKALLIEGLQKKLDKQIARSQQLVQDFEKKLKSAKEEGINYDEHNRKLHEKDKEHEQTIRGFEKKIRVMKESHQDELRQVKKENERKMQEMADRLRQEKQNNCRNSNFASIQNSPHFGVGYKGSSPQVENQRDNYQQQIRQLQKQNERLRKQMNSLSSKVNQKTQRAGQNWSEQLEQYKVKLEQANKQIVSLLLEKVSMKQQLGVKA